MEHLAPQHCFSCRPFVEKNGISLAVKCSAFQSSRFLSVKTGRRNFQGRKLSSKLTTFAAKSTESKFPRDENDRTGPKNAEGVEEDIEEEIVLDSTEAVLRKLARDMGVDVSELTKEWNPTPEEERQFIEDLNKVVEEEKRTGQWWGKNIPKEFTAEMDADLAELDREFAELVDELAEEGVSEDGFITGFEFEDEDDEDESDISDEERDEAVSGFIPNETVKTEIEVNSRVEDSQPMDAGHEEVEEDDDEKINGEFFFSDETVVLENVDINIEASEAEVKKALDILEHICKKMLHWKNSPSNEEEAELAVAWKWNIKRVDAIQRTADILTYFLEPESDDLPPMDANEDDLVLTCSILRRIKGTVAGMEMEQVGSGSVILEMVGLSIEELSLAETVVEQIIAAAVDADPDKEDENEEDGVVDVEAIEKSVAKLSTNDEQEAKELEELLKSSGATLVSPGAQAEPNYGGVEYDGGEQDPDALSAEDVGLVSKTLLNLSKKIKSEVAKKSAVAKLMDWDDYDAKAARVTGAVIRKMDELNNAFQGQQTDELIEIDGDDLELCLGVLDDLLEALSDKNEKRKGKLAGLGIGFDDLELAAAVLRQMVEEGEEVEEEIIEDAESEEIKSRLSELGVLDVDSAEEQEIPVQEDAEEVQATKESKELEKETEKVEAKKETTEVEKEAMEVEAKEGTKEVQAKEETEEVTKKEVEKPVLISRPLPQAEQTTESDDPPQRTVQLAKWQLRKLAQALAKGKRHVNVKALCGETGLDRRDVLAFLSNPPPGLDELDLGLDGSQAVKKKEPLPVTAARSEEQKAAVPKPKAAVEQGPWNPSLQQRRGEKKKLSRENEETLEKVFRKAKFPTGTVISSLVEVTHLSRKKILEWFSERRSSMPVKADAGLPTVEPSSPE